MGYWSSICQNLSCLATEQALASAFFHRFDNQRFIGFSHKQNWAVYPDERFCALMKHYVLLATQAKLKRKLLLLFGRDRLVRNPGTSVARVGKRLSSETLLYQNISIWFLLCYVKAIELQHIYKIWIGVMWSTPVCREEMMMMMMMSTLKISSGEQLGHVKRDIPAFDTVLFHLNLSSLRRKYKWCSNRQNSIEFSAKNIKEAFKKTLLVASK